MSRRWRVLGRCCWREWQRVATLPELVDHSLLWRPQGRQLDAAGLPTASGLRRPSPSRAERLLRPAALSPEWQLRHRLSTSRRRPGHRLASLPPPGERPWPPPPIAPSRGQALPLRARGPAVAAPEDLV